MVRAVESDYRQAALSAAERRMLDFAVKLTLDMPNLDESDVEALREVGFDDVAIHDIVQVTADCVQAAGRLHDASDACFQ